MSSATLNKLIEDFSILPLDDKEYAIEVIKKQPWRLKEKLLPKGPGKHWLILKRGRVKEEQ